jgi:hypothetical protein
MVYPTGSEPGVIGAIELGEERGVGDGWITS